MNEDFIKIIRDSLEYNPLNGEFKLKKRLSNRINIGDVAGSIHKKGYVIISLKGKRIFAHILAWCITYDRLPIGQIDHINHIPWDNRISNLREVSALENSRNLSMKVNNTSGITGVSFDRWSNKWVVRIKNNNGKYENRGRFNSISEAEFARDRALSELGYSQNHGK